MLDSRHYVPILKWKRAEQSALGGLDIKYRSFITPLVQIMMPSQTGNCSLDDLIGKFRESMPRIREKIIRTWDNDIFIDFSLLYTDNLRIEAINSILGLTGDSTFIPVMYLGDSDNLKNVVISIAKKNNSGLCLRLVCSDFAQSISIQDQINDLILSMSLSEEDIDLLIDIKEFGSNAIEYNKYFTLSQKSINLLKWRSFIFASGSFPEDLSGCKLEDENLVPRMDWMAWLSQRNQGVQRKPSFSDYTIQYPIYRESTQFFHPTTSIKYTLENDWMILKGKKQDFAKYLANANLLMRDKRFCGEAFSNGDRYIYEKGVHFGNYIKNPLIKGTGSTETWLSAGINHHLSLVAHQVSNLL